MAWSCTHADQSNTRPVIDYQYVLTDLCSGSAGRIYYAKTQTVVRGQLGGLGKT